MCVIKYLSHSICFTFFPSTILKKRKFFIFTSLCMQYSKKRKIYKLHINALFKSALHAAKEFNQLFFPFFFFWCSHREKLEFSQIYPIKKGKFHFEEERKKKLFFRYSSFNVLPWEPKQNASCVEKYITIGAIHTHTHSEWVREWEEKNI